MGQRIRIYRQPTPTLRYIRPDCDLQTRLARGQVRPLISGVSAFPPRGYAAVHMGRMKTWKTKKKKGPEFIIQESPCRIIILARFDSYSWTFSPRCVSGEERNGGARHKIEKFDVRRFMGVLKGSKDRRYAFRESLYFLSTSRVFSLLSPAFLYRSSSVPLYSLYYV